MSRRDNSPDASLALGHSRETNACCEQPIVEQSSRELMRRFSFAHHHRRDRRFTQPSIKTGALQTSFEITRVLPQLIDTLRLMLENRECRQARSRNRRRMRGRKQKWPSAMIQKFDQIAAAAHVPA